MGKRPVDILSTRSKAYRIRQDEIDALDDDALLAAMADEPTLIRRPLVISDGKLVSGYDRSQLELLVKGRKRNGQD